MRNQEEEPNEVENVELGSKAAENMEKKMPNLLIGVTGSVAAIKLEQIYQAFKSDYNIKIVATQRVSISHQLGSPLSPDSRRRDFGISAHKNAYG